MKAPYILAKSLWLTHLLGLLYVKNQLNFLLICYSHNIEVVLPVRKHFPSNKEKEFFANLPVSILKLCCLSELVLADRHRFQILCIHQWYWYDVKIEAPYRGSLPLLCPATVWMMHGGVSRSGPAPGTRTSILIHIHNTGHVATRAEPRGHVHNLVVLPNSLLKKSL